MNYTDKKIALVLRGDEIERLNQLIEETDSHNEAQLSLLCYVKNQIIEQLIEPIKDKQSYIGIYHELVNTGSPLDTEGVVGYYLSKFQEQALDRWIDTCIENPENVWSKNDYVTIILKKLCCA